MLFPMNRPSLTVILSRITITILLYITIGSTLGYAIILTIEATIEKDFCLIIYLRNSRLEAFIIECKI